MPTTVEGRGQVPGGGVGAWLGAPDLLALEHGDGVLLDERLHEPARPQDRVVQPHLRGGMENGGTGIGEIQIHKIYSIKKNRSKGGSGTIVSGLRAENIFGEHLRSGGCRLKSKTSEFDEIKRGRRKKA